LEAPGLSLLVNPNLVTAHENDLQMEGCITISYRVLDNNTQDILEGMMGILIGNVNIPVRFLQSHLILGA